MSKSKTYKDSSKKIGKYGSVLQRRYDEKEGLFVLDGHVVTSNGIVSVKSLCDVGRHGKHAHHSTRLEFVYMGRLFVREYDDWESHVNAGKAARNFAADVIANA